MKLVSVHKNRHAVKLLYKLLEERPKNSFISHKSMPTFQEHENFVRSHPFEWWYLIQVGDDYVGAIECTILNELGVAIFKEFQRKGYARDALRLFMDKHRPLPDIPARRVGKWLVNVAHTNDIGRQFFYRLGFKQVQMTMVLENGKHTPEKKERREDAHSTGRSVGYPQWIAGGYGGDRETDGEPHLVRGSASR